MGRKYVLSNLNNYSGYQNPPLALVQNPNIFYYIDFDNIYALYIP
jgi:hypothetical protein